MVKKISTEFSEISGDDQGGDDHPLMTLADEAAGNGAGQGATDFDVSEQARQKGEQDAADQAVAAMMGGVRQLAFGAIRAVRTRIARTLPEILDEWTDDAMAAPVDASVPVINKYAAKWMPLLGSYPEETALAMSLLPLVMGYVAAMEKHRGKVTQAVTRE